MITGLLSLYFILNEIIINAYLNVLMLTLKKHKKALSIQVVQEIY